MTNSHFAGFETTSYLNTDAKNTMNHTAFIASFSFLLTSCHHKANVDNIQSKRTNISKPPSTITNKQFLSKLNDKSKFVVLLTHPSCRISPKIKERISQTEHDWSSLYYMSGEQGKADEDFMKNHLPFTGVWPTLFAVKNGEVVDIIEGPNNMTVVANFVDRNVYKSIIKLEKPDLPKGQSFKTTLERVNYNTPVDLEGFDLSGIRLKGRSFSGFNLKNVDFSNAHLKRISFSKTDLTGARFDNAHLDDIFWGDTICPDGTPSKTQSYTCHLEGLATAVTSTSKDIPAGSYVTEKPEIRRAEDGAINLEDFLLGTAWMFGNKRETLYEKPTLLDKDVAYAHIKRDGKPIKAELTKNPDRFDYYLFKSKDETHSFILTVPANKETVFPHETAMYPY